MKRVRESLVGVLSLAALVTLNSCDEESAYEKRLKEDDNRIKTYLNENGVSATKHASGIYYDALETSSGGDEVEVGDVVSIYYKLSTLDSAYEEVMSDSLHPVMMEQNYTRMLPSGLADGLSLMKEGEKYRFFIPSHLAYSSYGSADFFDAHSIFIIDVEVVKIQDDDDVYEIEMDSIDSYIEQNNIEDVASFTSGLKYKILEEGDGDQPTDNSQVKIEFTRKYLDGSGEVKSDKPVTSQVNENYMVKGLIEGIKKMHEGETAMFIMPSEIAFGSSVQVLPQEVRNELLEDGILAINAKPFSPVIYEVELIEVN